MSTALSQFGLLALGTAAAPSPSHKASFKYKLNSSAVVPFEEPNPLQRVSDVVQQSHNDSGSQFTTTSSSIGGAPRRASLGKQSMDLPPALAKDGTCLSFKAFYNESVPESPLETWRTRLLVLKFHVDDGSLEAIDPNIRNDGMPHGRFLKRIVVPGITLLDMRVGGSLELFGRVVRIYAADGVARKYFRDVVGDEQPADEEPVADKFSGTLQREHNKVDPEAWHGVKSSAITRYIEAKCGKLRSVNNDAKERWNKYDGSLPLRFLLLWETAEEGVAANSTPDRRQFWLSYFLSDETVEIREAKKGEGKRSAGSFSKLVKRGRLPRTLIVHDDRGRSAEEFSGSDDYYSEDDFRVGGPLFVYGRDMVIADCDDYTQEWYAVEKGLDQRAARIETRVAPVEKVPLAIPPPLLGPAGIGGFNDEDTLNSWKYLIPKAPRVDLAKIRTATGKSLRYEAKLVTTDPVNASREFRITYFLDDSDVSVYEPPLRNSGCLSGIFQKRAKCINPLTGAAYKMSDFAIGSRVVVKGHAFTITALDEASRRAAESSPIKDTGDIIKILATLKSKLGDSSLSLRKMFRKFDKDCSQTISFPEFLAMLEHYGLPLSKADAIAVFHAFDVNSTGKILYDTFMKAFSSSEGVASSPTLSISGAMSSRPSLSSPEELQQMIMTAESTAREDDYKRYQELLVARVARDLSNTKDATRIHELFRRFDVNKDGKVSSEEFLHILGQGGLQYSGKDLAVLVDKFFHGAPALHDLDYTGFMSQLTEYSQQVIRSN